MMAGTTIRTLAQVAGVECPKEKEEMSKDDSCFGCDHFSACLMALPPELRSGPRCPECNERMSAYERKEYNRSTAEWRKLYLCPFCDTWWERRTDLEKRGRR